MFNLSRRQSDERGFESLIFYVFAAVGIWNIGWIWVTVIESHLVMKWEQVPARIKKVDLQESRSSKRPSYLTTGSFSYEVEGKQYHSTQLTLSNDYDRIGTFQKDFYEKLSSASKSGKPLTCWVNPDNHKEAVLQPQWRPDMVLWKGLFAVVGGCIGFGSLAALRLSNNSGGGRILKPRRTEVMVVSATVLLIYHATTLPLWAAFFPALEREDMGLTPFIQWALVTGLCSTPFLLKPILSWYKFRHATVELNDLSPTFGTSFQGRLVLPFAIPTGKDVIMKFEFINEVTIGSGKGAKLKMITLWSEKVKTKGPLKPGKPIPFSCLLPSNQPEEHRENNISSSHVYWILTVTIEHMFWENSGEFTLPPVLSPISTRESPLVGGRYHGYGCVN